MNSIGTIDYHLENDFKLIQLGKASSQLCSCPELQYIFKKSKQETWIKAARGLEMTVGPITKVIELSTVPKILRID